ncbi:MAG: beta-hydroxyacyl-ACP dehydratase [Planctomycetaceae bacterium]|nr:beta-hydroxyacyl-ACP dehydratase [Planctomycetaceae bacterium]MCA9116330.1 beta-hydroxyacyl-ACP dehydratase [Planctomycetaceae bacterium]
MPPRPLIDWKQFNYDKPQFSLEDVRRVNPQRHEMEQLSGIVHVDEQAKMAVGFKDVTPEEFWTAGHMPGFPLMPGVILCECAAQLSGFLARKFNMLGGDYLGFGGMDNVRFRSPVFPGSRLIIVVQMVKLRPKRRAEFEFQEFVGDRMVVSGGIIGVPIERNHQIN